MKPVIPLLGRVFLSQIFLLAGLDKIMSPGASRDYMAQAGLPFTRLFLVAAIVLEIGGGLSLLLGYKARYGAAALILFLVPATLIFHIDFQNPIQVTMLLKNLAIIGGLLMVAHFGPGSFAIDKFAE